MMMEKLEKKEKKGNEWPDDMRSGIQLALTKIKADGKASMALRALKGQGFDEVRLAKIVYFYCGGTERQAQAGLQAMLEFADDLGSMARQLLEDSERLKRIIKKLEQGGTGVISMTAVTHVPGIVDGTLPTSMRDFGEMLLILAKSYEKGLKNIRIGGKERRGANRIKGEKQELNISAGRTQWLLYLAYLIGGDKGPGISHYLQIARLVAAVRGDREPVYTTIAQTLQHAARKFQEEDLGRACLLAATAQEEFDRHRPSS
jgi:hypothetical protein